MSLDFKEILQIPVTINKKQYILEEIGKYLSGIKNKESGIRKKWIKPLVIYTPNPEIINFASQNEYFKMVVRKAQINIPDGAGVVWAMQRLHKTKINRLSGVEMFEELVFLAAKKGFTIGLIGGRDGVALKAAECLQEKYKNLKITVFPSSEFWVINEKLQISNDQSRIKNKKSNIDKYLSELARQINKNKIDILFVALGFPKQEIIIERIKNYETGIWRNKPIVLMAIGGTLDYVSGAIPRAPKWMRNIGLEWLFRLVIEPKRIVRQIKGGEFFLRVLFKK